MTIEDIILDRDGRGISALRPHLPADFCDQAAQLIFDNPGTAIIVTGFYILTAGITETDGPPGAIAIDNALKKRGYEVVHVTDKHTAPLMESLVSEGTRVVDFPITGDEESKKFAEGLLAEISPSVVIAIELTPSTNVMCDTYPSAVYELSTADQSVPDKYSMSCSARSTSFQSSGKST